MKNFMQKSLEEPDVQPPFEPPMVTEYMTAARYLITFHPDTEVGEVVEKLLEHRITGAPVLSEKGDLVGLIDDKDCLKILFDVAYHNQPVKNTSVSHYMSNVMRTVSPETNILDIADTFLNTIYKRLLVVNEDGKLLGQISRRDILRAIRDFNSGRG